jgi:hypothetical protein
MPLGRLRGDTPVTSAALMGSAANDGPPGNG